MMTVRVQKWGNSLGMRIPKAVAERSSVRAGTELEIFVEDGRIVLCPPSVPTLSQLVAEINPDNRPTLVEWGAARGKEVW